MAGFADELGTALQGNLTRMNVPPWSHGNRFSTGHASMIAALVVGPPISASLSLRSVRSQKAR